MIPLKFELVDREEAFDEVRNYLHEFDFSLGGNWDYEHGYFDRSLDEANKVWLRIPFEVTHGALDGDADSTDAIIHLGTPFVLKHVYNEGLDKEAKVNFTGALIDQFQEPVDKDAPVEAQWVDKAQDLLSQVESTFPS
ncbi:YugN-like family protein [Paenibacillus radicis (ex Xue et al. 2023)]|uniref:YugN-like family protein n=1 Tax=Paenibacillus radicis (ex Xue et al. 2023) TaxID=2972489 RepID=A0ABT1YN15_9BACL|nr:YugN-like family protein [Paenibacillus radicis (ex Xue et al. 2023)]MCR8633390.1 YugN-like family protein [Paenibacillus radicis (ex Xue et al. 2023)]